MLAETPQANVEIVGPTQIGGYQVLVVIDDQLFVRGTDDRLVQVGGQHVKQCMGHVRAAITTRGRIEDRVQLTLNTVRRRYQPEAIVGLLDSLGKQKQQSKLRKLQ